MRSFGTGFSSLSKNTILFFKSSTTKPDEASLLTNLKNGVKIVKQNLMFHTKNIL